MILILLFTLSAWVWSGDFVDEFGEVLRKLRERMGRFECEGRVLVLDGRTKVFEHPSERSYVLAELGRGEEVCVVSRVGKWMRVYTRSNLLGFIRVREERKREKGFRRYLTR